MEQAPPLIGFPYLPDDVLLHILSFLPTELAAQTSLVSRRFHRLWKASCFLNLDTYSEYMSPSQFLDLANQTLVQCNPLSPLLHLRISLLYRACKASASTSDILSLLKKASALGLRHLSVGLDCKMFTCHDVWEYILSMHCIESLSLEDTLRFYLSPSTPINLKHLRSLSVKITNVYKSDYICQLVPRLHSLDDLHIRSLPNAHSYLILNLKSETLRKLKLDLGTHNYVSVSAPSLELLELKSVIKKSFNPGDWQMPKLRKAVIQLKLITMKNVEAIFNMLFAIAHVQELHINIKESQDQTKIFHALLLPGLHPPTFSNLKHFNLQICFHEYNIEDLITLLQQSPALENHSN